MSKKEYRNSFEFYYDILQIAQVQCIRRELGTKGNLSFDSLMIKLNILIKNKLIKSFEMKNDYRQSLVYYKTTSKGVEFMRKYEELLEFGIIK